VKEFVYGQVPIVRRLSFYWSALRGVGDSSGCRRGPAYAKTSGVAEAVAA